MQRINSGARASAIVRFDNITIWFHWTTLLLIVAMFASAIARESASDGNSAAALLTLHRSTGVVLWLLTLGRLAWKVTMGRSPPLPAHIPGVQRWAARATEYGLFLLLIVQPITGFVQSVARGKPFALLGLSFPAVAAHDRDLTHLFATIHTDGALALLALIAVHSMAALLHHFILRDNVLRTMLPAGGSATPDKFISGGRE